MYFYMAVASLFILAAPGHACVVASSSCLLCACVHLATERRGAASSLSV